MDFKYFSEHKTHTLVAVCAGIASAVALKKFAQYSSTTYLYFNKRSFLFPDEIDFSDEKVRQQLGNNLNEFLANLNKHTDEYLLRLHAIYPNECSLKLASSQRVVFLNSIESYKKFSEKVSGSEPIANRPQNPILRLVSKNYLGTFFRLYDDKLKEIRKSSLAALHKISGNSVEFEGKLTTEVEDFLTFINSQCLLGKNGTGRLNSASVHLQQISTNMIVTIGIDARFSYDLDSSTAVKSQINDISDILSALDIVNMSNLSDASAFKPLEPKLNSIYSFLTGAINEYKKNYEKDVIQTFADYVISKQLELGKLSDDDVYSDRDILVQFFTLLMAGAVTTGFTSSWAFFFLGTNPSVQAKMYEEMAHTVGTGSFIGTKHRVHLKYCEAVVNEILRMSSTQPLLSRATLANQGSNNNNIDIDAYSLPPNTPVFVNAYAIHRDSKYWQDSDRFDPTRWLTDNGDLIPHLNSFLAFGAGARSCIGDSLSRMILFLIVVNVVQRFEISVPAGQEKLAAKVGVMRRPPNYDLDLKVRS